MSQPDVRSHIPTIIAAAGRPEVVAAMRRFYEDADRDIATQPATCWNRGDCCRFGQFGHRLFVTSLEVCYYIATGEMPPPITDDTCPHAFDGKCHARDRRPLGCRIFYCDPNAQSWQGPFTEDRLAVLRDLHQKLDVPYVYADWMAFLRTLRQTMPK
jgi:hypothetical protein